MAGEGILGSTYEEVVSASGGMFASLNLLQAFKMAGEDIQGSTNEEVVSVISTFTDSGRMFASLNLLQAFNPQLCLKWSILMCLDIRFL
jgi:hypothetical protein